MSAKTPIASNLKLFRAKKKLLKDFITNDPYLSGELGNYKHGTLFRHDIVFISITDGSHTADLFTGEGEDFLSAFASAMNSAEKYVSDNDIVPLWVKVRSVPVRNLRKKYAQAVNFSSKKASASIQALKPHFLKHSSIAADL